VESPCQQQLWNLARLGGWVCKLRDYLRSPNHWFFLCTAAGPVGFPILNLIFIRVEMLSVFSSARCAAQATNEAFWAR